jgi:Tol biopolymer transport system component
MRHLALLALAALLVAVPAASGSGPLPLERVSVTGDGSEANGLSGHPALSGDGRYVAFSSYASNLVPGDHNGTGDVFVRDRLMGTIERVSVAGDGGQANDLSEEPAISGDGRYVAFGSHATNLVPGDTNWSYDVFVRDRLAGTTERVSVAGDGGDANGASGEAALSGDGRYVAFSSYASNLVPGDTNNNLDVFVRDRLTGTTERVSVTYDGSPTYFPCNDPALSGDGRYVAFASWTPNLVPGDTNGTGDVFVRDRLAGTTERVSVAGDGSEANAVSGEATLSGDGRYVGFSSGASNLVPGHTGTLGVFVRDRLAGTTEQVSVAGDGSQANSHSQQPALSGDGRYVAFYSNASNIVPGDTNAADDVFVRDRSTGTTERVSVAGDGSEPNGGSSPFSAISGDGRYVAFGSDASNLVPGDTNAATDVFVRDLSQTSGADMTPPVFGAAPDVIAEASGPLTPLTLTRPGATDEMDGQVPVSCDNPAAFALGATTVHCAAADRAGNTAHASFTVTVRDTTPPALTPPGDISVDAAGPDGKSVSFGVSASDLVDGPVPVTCTPASGSMFPIGVTLVDCSASDNAANMARVSFNVSVRGAPDQVAALRTQVAALGLKRLLAAGLDAELRTAQAALAIGRPALACTILRAFTAEVRLLDGHGIPSPVAADLIRLANQIRTVIGCG